MRTTVRAMLSFVANFVCASMCLVIVALVVEVAALLEEFLISGASFGYLQHLVRFYNKILSAGSGAFECAVATSAIFAARAESNRYSCQ